MVKHVPQGIMINNVNLHQIIQKIPNLHVIWQIA